MLPRTPEPPLTLSFIGLAVYAGLGWGAYQVLHYAFPIVLAWFAGMW